MKVGYRAVGPSDVGRWGPGLIQVSVYRSRGGGVEGVQDVVSACRKMGHQHVLHPVGYAIVRRAGDLQMIMRMAHMAGRAMVLHDEWAPGRKKFEGADEDRFLEALRAIEAITPVSFENANNTAGAPWFWSRYARSVTLDIGHVEAWGLDSVQFVRSLPDETVRKIQYVHMHHNAGLRGGLTDHWPLTEGCRELRALGELLLRKTDLTAILELNEPEGTPESIRLLRELAQRHGAAEF